MRTIFILFSLGFSVCSFSQNFSKFRYTSSTFDVIDTLKDVEYANAPFLNNLIDEIPQLAELNVHEGEDVTENRPLHMDIYMPSNDDVVKRPAIIFVHGGGFLIGSKHNEDMVALCDSFARMGYVTASIQYRLGVGSSVTRNFGIITNIDVDSDNFSRSVYRGIQDGKAAVRFLKSNAAVYGIDSSKVFMSGSSAGAFVTLHNNYMDKASEIPDAAFNDPTLGGLDEIGSIGPDSKVNAIAPFWGAIQSTDLIEADTTPSLLIHGTGDEVVLFKDGKPLQNLVPPNPLITFDVPVTYGSYCIDTALDNRNVSHEKYFVEGENHEFYGVSNGEFPPEGPNAYWDTVFNKVNSFFNDQHKPLAGFVYETNGLTISVSNTSKGESYYQWNFGDGDFSNEENPLHEYVNDGIYNVELLVQNDVFAWDKYSLKVNVGSSAKLYTVSYLVKLNNFPVEDAQISLTGYGNQLTDENGELHFENVIEGDTIPYMLDQFSGAHVYYDTIFELRNDTLITLEFFATDKPEQLLSAKLYPNPNNGRFNVDANVNTAMNVYSISGQLVRSEDLEEGSNFVDLSYVEKGVYFVKLITRNEVISYKVIVE